MMSKFWVRFAQIGNPNGGDSPVWPAYGPETREYLELGQPIRVGTGIRTKQCDLYDELQSHRLGGGRP